MMHLRLAVSPLDQLQNPIECQISIPENSLIARIQSVGVPSSHIFILHIYDVETVLYCKAFNDTFTITNDFSTCSILKLFQLWLAHIDTFTTTIYQYSFQVYAENDSTIEKYIASLQLLHNSEPSEAFEDVTDDGYISDESGSVYREDFNPPSKPVYIQLSDEERNSLSPYVRWSDDDTDVNDNDRDDDIDGEINGVFDDGVLDDVLVNTNIDVQLGYPLTDSFESLPEELSLDIATKKRRFRKLRKRRKLLVYDPERKSRVTGFLILNIASAKGLPPFKDSIRIRYDMDPFVVVSFGTKIFRTGCKRHSLNPVWNDQYVNLEISSVEEDFEIKFNVVDKDRFSFNDPVCSIKVPVKRFLVNDNDWHEMKLSMQIDPKSSKKFVDYQPFLEIKYKFQRYLDIVKEVGKLYPQLDLLSTHLFHHCPLCHRPDKRNSDFIKHLSICQSDLTSNIFLRKSYITANSASRRWYSKALIKIAYGKLQLGGNNANIMVQDRDSGLIIEERMSVHVRLGIRMLYKSIKSDNTSRRIKKMLAKMSKKQGMKFDQVSSARKIAAFIKFYALDLSDCLLLNISEYRTFNEFFYRKLRPETRTIEGDPLNGNIVTSCADSRLTVFHEISLSKQVWIKGRDFKVSKIMGEPPAAKFENGSIAIFRLAPQDYHRFHSPVCGTITKVRHIEGEYYTVNPMAVRSKLDVFGENVRTVIHIDTEEFGTVVLCAVGAMMVGSIIVTKNPSDIVMKGDELGYFKFGGSTVIMLFQQGRIQFDKDILYNSEQRSIETLVKMGMSVGHTPTTRQFGRHPSKKFDALKVIRKVTGGRETNDNDFYPSWEVKQLDVGSSNYEIEIEKQ
ncbi:hypothetical protein FOA43_004600 [Brettanomyces nanus]|uniref:phosphatidylserine decarboxylase n=1 Tax=Eeniella nana TaxID=13502 RepID=A0A875S8H8_EENNA|nr:uncharacterized protein FOA43_004600 [Brettanomyces nanus]QPG77193.1 hypothetical protein FOA43_004600 [Brettanomyces nanus]